MASLVLGVAGAAVGSVFGPVGALVGRAAGAVAGSVLDQGLFGARKALKGPRLSELQVQGSTEGAVIPRLYGRARLAGQLIWATDFLEKKETEEVGGKGGPSVTSTEYTYFANFAVALCEGPIARVGRIWADGKLLDASEHTIRVHRGDEAQEADSLIVAKQGGEAPAYRGTAYVVFERLALADFGNRIPQLAFEVVRAVGALERNLRAVCVIPGATEFGYDTQAVIRREDGRSASENAHGARGVTDWTASIDELQALCPKLEWVTLVVAWFGDDLRAGHCTVRPKVDDPDKTTSGGTWRVAGVSRDSAQRVSLVEGRPAYGGSPSDASVMRAIQDLRARGLKVALAPFVLMDIAAGNALPDPKGATEQPAFPWRGGITCIPAPGLAGSPDKSGAAAAAVADFLGGAEPGDFGISGGAVVYSGPAAWRYRRMVLHYAKLCVLAGGVDALLIGSELRGLTTLRSATNVYPFVTGLKALAADVRTVVGSATQISYAADWSEYLGHQPKDGSGDAHFHLDPLWADGNVDFVGIDLYHPLADWRDETGHADQASGRSRYDHAYLRANVRGGEGFDWYYAGPADRDAQIRTPITDDAAGKPWVFRFKDIEAWWSNAHFDRPGGVEAGGPTDWTPRSKPIWLTELGCPAVDKGANQPNVFVDAKSSESALPHFSDGERDDLAQRRYVETYQRFFDPDHSGFDGANPVSPLYGEPMVAPDHLHVWTWDARPYPFFPDRPDIWSDGANWARGHWLNGRLGAVPLDALIDAVMAEHGFADYAAADVEGIVDGVVVNEILSARETLEPLLRAFRIDAADAGDRILFRGRTRQADATLVGAELVEQAGEPLLTRRRAQETELTSELTVRFLDGGSDYRLAAASSRRLAGQSQRSGTLDLPAVLRFADAERIAGTLLRDIWTGRESVELKLPPSWSAVEAGDILALPDGAKPEILLAERIEDGRERHLSLRCVDNEIVRLPRNTGRAMPPATVPTFGAPEVASIEFAPPDGVDAHAPRLAVFADPWPGTAAVYGAAEGGGFRHLATLTNPAIMGRLSAPLAAGPWGVFDAGNAIEVALFGGDLASLPDIDVLGGGNAAAVRMSSGDWEVLQFAQAELTGERRYRLTRLLRGQCGTEAAMLAGAAAGAAFVLLNAAVTPLPMRPDAIGVPLRVRVGPARDDHAAPSFIEIGIMPQGRGLRPFAPAHLTTTRDPTSGDVTATWVRRTRFGGVGWEPAETPLNEEREAYRIEVFEGADLRRQIEVTLPAFAYSAADQLADLGGAGPFTLRISQLSAVAGPGAALTELVDV